LPGVKGIEAEVEVGDTVIGKAAGIVLFKLIVAVVPANAAAFIMREAVAAKLEAKRIR
jgi:hypothetical protein